MMSLAALKRVLPPKLRAVARETWRARMWERNLRSFIAASRDPVPDRALVSALRDTWGNEGFSADLDFLVETVDCAARTGGPVLECGTGLTTILLGVLAGRRSVEVWSLEHEPSWHDLVAGVLRRHHIGAVRLCLAPLRSYGAFDWYAPPMRALPKRFSLVVCDGPPEATRGGRYGLWPVLKDRFEAGTTILLDDAGRESESRMLDQWTREADLRVDLRQLPSGTYARIEVLA